NRQFVRQLRTSGPPVMDFVGSFAEGAKRFSISHPSCKRRVMAAALCRFKFFQSSLMLLVQFLVPRHSFSFHERLRTCAPRRLLRSQFGRRSCATHRWTGSFGRKNSPASPPFLNE